MPVSRGKISATQLDYLDKLDNHLTGGGSFASFKQASHIENGIINSLVDELSSPVAETLGEGTSVPKGLTEDDGQWNIPINREARHMEDSTWQTSQLSLQQLSIALNHLIKTLTVAEKLGCGFASPNFSSLGADPLAHYEQLQRACDKSWLLTSREALRGEDSPRKTSRKYALYCSRSHASSGTNLGYTRDIGTGIYKNLLHLSLSFFDVLSLQPLPKNTALTEEWLDLFFGDYKKLLLVQPPQSEEGLKLDVWHYRLNVHSDWSTPVAS